MGFFTLESEKSESKRHGRVGAKRRASPAMLQHTKELAEHFNSKGCLACPLDKISHMLTSPKMPATGEVSPVIYVLAEAPGKDEDETGEQLVGRSGQLLWEMAAKEWPPDFFEMVRKNNVINCRPPGNATPEFDQIEACRPRVIRDIEQTRPPYILCLGTTASKWVTNHNAGISDWRGRWMPVRIGTHVCWTFHAYHPAYIVRSGEMDTHVFLLDLKRFATDIIQNTLPPPDVISSGYYDGVTVVTGNEPQAVDSVVNALKQFAAKPRCAIDLETTGLRPTRSDKTRILCVALSDYESTFVFALDHQQAAWTVEDRLTIKKTFVEFLLSPCVKTAHNAPFEQEWLAHFFGLEVITETPWGDTMAQATVLDKREGMLGLDALVQQYFGFPFKALSAVNTASNLELYSITDLLRYCGLDAKYTHLLYGTQAPRIQPHAGLQATYEHLVQSGITTVLSQLQGLPVNWSRVKELRQQYQQEIEIIETELQEQSAVKQVANRFGGFNHRSVVHRAHLFRDVLQRPEGQTASGNYNTPAPVLQKMDDEPCAALILKIREYEKVLDTYIKNLDKIVHADKKLHTNYSTMFTSTGRLSSRDPNVQNFPVRRHREVREVVIPPPGHYLVSFDYGQIEARLIAMSSLDPVFVDAIWNSYDVHMEWADRIGVECLQWVEANGGDDGRKDRRQLVKNQWVFPLFYGSSVTSVANALGIPAPEAQTLYNEFWGTFAGVKRWQHRLKDQYDKQGYCETMHGRRLYAPIGWNQIINHPIQGGASDIVTAAANRLWREHGLVCCLNIHDDLGFFIPDDQLEQSIQIIATEMTRPVHPWMTVPLVVECKAGLNWGKQEEIAVFSSVDLHNHVR